MPSAREYKRCLAEGICPDCYYSWAGPTVRCARCLAKRARWKTRRAQRGICPDCTRGNGGQRYCVAHRIRDRRRASGRMS